MLERVSTVFSIFLLTAQRRSQGSLLPALQVGENPGNEVANSVESWIVAVFPFGGFSLEPSGFAKLFMSNLRY